MKYKDDKALECFGEVRTSRSKFSNEEIYWKMGSGLRAKLKNP